MNSSLAEQACSSSQKQRKDNVQEERKAFRKGLAVSQVKHLLPDDIQDRVNCAGKRERCSMKSQMVQPAQTTACSSSAGNNYRILMYNKQYFHSSTR